MKIVIRENDKIVNELPMPETGSLALGRQPDVNDIIINDIKASRKHGKLSLESGKVMYEDLGSGNGSFINDEQIAAATPVELAAGTRVVIGEWSISVEEGEVAGESAAAPVSSGISKLPEGKTGMLVGMDDQFAGKKYGLGDRPLFLGRIPACHIQVNDALASRRNTEIRLEGGQYNVKDLGSSNGTFLNDKKIDEAVLADGDVLRIGSIRFRFGFVDVASAPEVPSPQTLDAAPAGAPAGSAPQAPASSGKGGGAGALVGVAVVIVLAVGGYMFLGKGAGKNGDSQTPAQNGGATEAVPENTAPKAFPVTLGKPMKIDMPVTIEKTADVKPAKESKVILQAGAKVREVYVKNQQRVKKGDKLVALEITEALNTARTQAVAAVNSAQADVRKAESALKNAEDNLKIAQESFDKNKPLYDGGNLVQVEWDKIRKNRNNATTDVDVKKQEKTQAADKVTQAMADLKDVQGKIDDLTPSAENGGVVTGLDLKPGYTVTPANRTISIIEYESEVKVVAPIPEDDIARIKEGMKAEVWLPKAPERVFEGHVSMIPATAQQRSYNVELMVANKDRHFRPGAQAMVKFIVDVRKGATAVPGAVVGTGKRGGYYVFKYDPKEKRAVRIAVKRGVESTHEGKTVVELLPDPDSVKSLGDGDILIFDGHKNLQDGALVEAKNAAEMGVE